jgi:hypothetical protein
MSTDHHDHSGIERLHDASAMREIIRHSPDEAQHTLRLFTPVLSDPMFNSIAWAESMARFCARHANNNFSLLVEDVKACRRQNGVLLDHLRKVSDHVGWRQVAEQHRGLREFILIIDDKLVLHQPSLDSLETVVIRDYRPRIKDFTDRFVRMWQRATPQTLSTLGL